MKNTIFTLVLLALSVCSVTAQTADETAIRAAIEGESKAFHTNTDRAAFAAYWHLSADARMVYTGPDGTSAFMTNNDLKGAVTSGQLPPDDNAVSEMTNYVIKASGNIGWATFDQKSTAPDGKVSYMHEFRCFEKVGTDWKIVSSSVHEYKPK